MIKTSAAVLVAVAAIGCGTPAPHTALPAESPPKTSAPPQSPSRHPPPKSMPATIHPLLPTQSLVAWIERNARRDGSRTTFRVPVVILFDEYHLQFEKVFIGTEVGAPPAEHVALELDDTAMSVGMMDQLRGKFPGDAKGCAVWLEGHWGPLIDDDDSEPPPGFDPNAHAFAVRAVGDIVRDAASAHVAIK